MVKRKFGHGLQIVALLIFIVMALACASQSSMVGAINDATDSSGTSASGSRDGSSIEVSTDSLSASYDLALN